MARYVSGWVGASHTSNPVSSYHLLRRITFDYQDVLSALRTRHGDTGESGVWA